MMLSNTSPRSRWIARLVAPLSAAMLAWGACAPSSAAVAQGATETPQPGYVLPDKPSNMLRAPLTLWKPVLAQVGATLDQRAKAITLLGRPALIELNVQRTVLAQTRREWRQVLDAVGKSRQLQDSEAGREIAGLLNELLARQALQRGDAAWLQRRLRDQVLAMPWAEVEPSIRALRQNLAQMNAETIEAYVIKRLDTSTNVTENRVNLAFVMQLLAMRFQLLEVVPHRDALIAGLDEAIARRSPAAAASAAGA